MSPRLKGNLWIALAFFASMGLGEQSPALGGFGILACIIYAIIFNRKYKKENLSSNSTTSFELDENGYFRIISFQKNPMAILVKINGKARREVYKINYISIDKQGNYYFQCLDEFNKEANFYYYETASLITFNNQAYHTFDELVLAMTNKKFFKKFEQLRNNYLSHLQHKATSN